MFKQINKSMLLNSREQLTSLIIFGIFVLIRQKIIKISVFCFSITEKQSQLKYTIDDFIKLVEFMIENYF